MSLILENVSKTYPNGVKALNGVSLNIPTGMFGLLGPNGAGKSTLMRTVATLQEPDSGTIRFRDMDVLRDKEGMRRVLGYLPQEFGFYPTLSAEETLDHFACLKGVANGRDRRETVRALLQQVNLFDVRGKRVGGFSGGMLQRLGIAVALVGRPQIVIVDEPTAGLDPTERNRFLNLLAGISEEVTVILSTHIVEDVRELCRQMAIIAQGQVIAEGDPEAVIARVAGKMWQKTVEKSELDAIEGRYHVISRRLMGGRPAITIHSETEPGDGFRPIEADLEDAYFFHTGAPGKEA
jgi:ABC-2 type transport system ATP-binding protein